ncbi:hypothetical protein CPB84DRAFT_1764797 [Gymnopilus junonius]|uniref:Uncharacterized protein n=1 Tax=Gymnopilus junonius TaxID=109634 RepID=A0A9P5NZ35_GYMJU|nr:hypothetical protein CPB84DRAFT_1764797 [Gymnopilus junonius]
MCCRLTDCNRHASTLSRIASIINDHQLWFDAILLLSNHAVHHPSKQITAVLVSHGFINQPFLCCLLYFISFFVGYFDWEMHSVGSDILLVICFIFGPPFSSSSNVNQSCC